MIMDAEMRIVYINKAFSTITGYLEDEVMGRKPIDFKNRRKTESCLSQYLGKWSMREGNWQGRNHRRKKRRHSIS